MTSSTGSWHQLTADPPELRLPADLAKLDPRGAKDIGWVSQMQQLI